MKLSEMPVMRPMPDWTEVCTLKQLYRQVVHGTDWMIDRNWHFTLPNGVKVVIPAGFITDLASVPRWAWAIMSPFGVLLIPGIIHDFGYRYTYLWAIDERGMLFKYGHHQGKEFWDRIFLEVGNAVNHMPKINNTAHFLLSTFGEKAWNENRTRNEPDLLISI